MAVGYWVFTREQWQALKPETLIGSVCEGRYVGFFRDTNTGIMLDLARKDVVRLELPNGLQVRCVHHHVNDDCLYLGCSDGAVYQFEAGYGRRDPSGWDVAMQGMNFMNNAMRTGQAIGEQRYQTAERDGVNQALEHISGKLGNQGDISQFDGDPILNTRHGTMAMGQFMQQRANTETSRLQMLKAMEASDDQFYQKTFRPMAFAAQEAFKAGDMQRFSGIASELAAKSPMPYRLIAGQDGNFDVEFRSDAAGGWTRTNQRLTPQQAMAEIDGILSGEQQILSGANMQVRTVNPRFLAASSRYKMGTIRGNAEAMADPKKWITLTKGGQNISVIPQNRHDDYSAAPSYLCTLLLSEHTGFILRLQVDPHFHIRAEVAGKAQGRISGDSSPLMHNFMQTGHRNSKSQRQSVYAEMKRGHVFLTQNFSGVNGKHD